VPIGPDPTRLAVNIDEYLRQHQRKELLRFLTCGSVDDGKSTLIGRLLYESKQIFDDQLTALEGDSKKWGTQGGALDLALLVDGLTAEREQGITIDVAYRFFSTGCRTFIVADTPGHEQYTRNMVTGASTADLAVILIDARKGVLTQTRRHSYLVALLGIRHVLLAINKMDLVDFSEARFRAIADEYGTFATSVGLTDVTAIPLSALKGDNVTASSPSTPWYDGPTLLDALEQAEVDETRLQTRPLRLPVQWVNRATDAFRGFAGTLASGAIRTGDRIRAQPSGRESTVSRIVSAGRDLSIAVAGQSITITLADEIDISRGDVISAANAPAEVADQFETTIVWMHDDAMLVGRQYWLKTGSSTVPVQVTELKYKVNVNTLEHVAARTLGLNDIGICNIALDRPIPFDPYAENRDTTRRSAPG
jgi:bifunctional enzyme CysN/CysC